MPPRAHDFGLLSLRLGVGGTLVAHGTQKLFGWFGGPGLRNTGEFFASIGFRPGRVNAAAAGLGEAGGGALLALGLCTPVAGAAVAGTMVVAASLHQENGFFAQGDGYEYPALLSLVAASLALGGPGDLSLDAALKHQANRPWIRAVALATVPAATTLMLRRRRAALAATAAAAATPPGVAAA